MKEFKKILFPLDLSESSIKIVPFVQGMAAKHGALIHLLFVARVFDYFTYFTIWSNILVATISIMLFIRPDRDSFVFRVLRLDSILMITVTGIIYNVVLAGSAKLQGLEVVSNIFDHMLTLFSRHGLFDLDLEVDGGVTADNAAEIAKAGANALVAGSAIFKGKGVDDYRKTVDTLRKAAEGGRG